MLKIPQKMAICGLALHAARRLLLGAWFSGLEGQCDDESVPYYLDLGD
jgi:hypothetical protein